MGGVQDLQKIPVTNAFTMELAKAIEESSPDHHSTDGQEEMTIAFVDYFTRRHPNSIAMHVATLEEQ
jgi:hypothetical protein